MVLVIKNHSCCSNVISLSGAYGTCQTSLNDCNKCLYKSPSNCRVRKQIAFACVGFTRVMFSHKKVCLKTESKQNHLGAKFLSKRTLSLRSRYSCMVKRLSVGDKQIWTQQNLSTSWQRNQEWLLQLVSYCHQPPQT